MSLNVLYVLHMSVHVQCVRHVCLTVSKLFRGWTHVFKSTTCLTHEYITYWHINTSCADICTQKYIFIHILHIHAHIPNTSINLLRHDKSQNKEERTTWHPLTKYQVHQIYLYIWVKLMHSTECLCTPHSKTVT
jgi:hypothetical protein